MARPRQYDDDLRVRLLDTAARLLAEEGPHAISTRRVAAEVGTSTNAIYSLIGSKNDLVRALYDDGFRRLAENLAAVPVTDDPLADLYELGLAYHDTAIARPHLYGVMFGRPVREFEPAQADLELSLSTLQVLIDAVRRAVAAGALAGDPEDLALQLWGMNHGVTSLELAGALGPPDHALPLVERAMRAAIEGFVALDAAPTARR